MVKVEMFSDGGCRGNGSAENVGGYGVVLRCNGKEKEIGFGCRNTTNNKMELGAVVRGLEELKFPCEVNITTDSNYVVRGATEWLQGWIRKGWVNSKKEPVANKEIWQKLIPMLEKHKVTFTWVKGHAGHPENERCDAIANEEMDKIGG